MSIEIETEKTDTTKAPEKAPPKDATGEKKTPPVETKQEEEKADSGAKDADLAGLFAEETEDKTETKPADKGDKLSIAIPEDLKDAIDAKTLDGYAAKAVELGMTQQQLDGLVGHHFDALREQAASVEAEYRTQIDAWTTELKTDPEIGGAKLKESVTLAKEGALKLGGQALVKYLKESGLCNQPALFRALRNAGLRMRDDTIGEPGQKPRTGEETLSKEELRQRKMYPNTIAVMKRAPNGTA